MILAFARSLTWRAWAALVAVALILTLAVTIYQRGKHAGEVERRAEQAQQAAETAQRARKADVAAQDSLEREKALSGAEIARGREAARDSDDPWADAVGAMR